MTRFLGLVILFLHVFSDIRRRISLPTTAAVLACVGILVIVGMITFDLTSTKTPSSRLISQAHVAQHEPYQAAVPGSLAMHNSMHMPALSTLSFNRNRKAIAPAAPSDAAPVTPIAIPAPQTSLPQENDAVQATGQSSAQKPVSAVLLAAPQLVCTSKGESEMTIATGVVTMQTPLTVTTNITWHWETRVDGGDTSAQPPFSSAPIIQQTGSTGQSEVPLANNDSSGSFVILPESTIYAYSVRVHMITPVEAVSDWVSVPLSTAPCSS